jgi:hypothetical protein
MMIIIDAPNGPKTTKLIQANINELNPLLDIHDNMYADNNFLGVIYEPPLIKRMVAASIEAI